LISTLQISCLINNGFGLAVAAETRFFEHSSRIEKLPCFDVYEWKSRCYRFTMETTRVHTTMLLRDIANIMLRTTLAVVAVASVAVFVAAHSTL
jgi:hypothetical protein